MLGIDGNANAIGTGAVPPIATLTTTKANDIIVAFLSWDGSGATPFTISDTAMLNWNLRASDNTGANTAVTREYYAVAPAALTGDAITATGGSGGVRLSLMVFAISGANTSTPYDSNGSLPSVANDQGIPTSIYSTLSTTNANDIIYGHINIQGQGVTFTPSSGYTVLSSYSPGGNTESEVIYYQIVASTQSVVSVGAAWAPTESASLINDAITQAGGSSTLGNWF